MKLFTKEIDTKLFEQYLTGSDLENQMVVAKIFNPYGRGTWYLLNSDPEDPEYLWAIVDMDDIEVGSVNRSDLENIRIKPFMLGLERDLSFRQMNALELYEGLNEGKKYVKGGGVESENKEMVLNNNKQIAHHTKELQNAIKGKNVPAWVVAKVNRSASDLSDATHYMEGQGKSYADGGGVDDKFTKGDKVTDGRGNVGIIKEVQVNGSLYIQWISYSGEPTSDLTADNNPENIEKMALGGGVGQPYDSMTKYQLDKEYKKLNEKRDILKKKYGKFDSTEIVENEKEIDKIITLLYGENFSGVGQKYKYAEGGGVGDDMTFGFKKEDVDFFQEISKLRPKLNKIELEVFDKSWRLNDKTFQWQIQDGWKAKDGQKFEKDFKTLKDVIPYLTSNEFLEYVINPYPSYNKKGWKLKLSDNDYILFSFEIIDGCVVNGKFSDDDKSMEVELYYYSDLLRSYEDYKFNVDVFSIGFIKPNKSSLKRWEYACVNKENLIYLKEKYIEGVTNIIKAVDYFIYKNKKSNYAEGGGVKYIPYKDEEIMHEPSENKYYANDEEFDTLKEAQNYIDRGSPMSAQTINAYRHGAFKDGGKISDFKMVSFPEDKTYKYYVVDEDKYNYLTVQEDVLKVWKTANKLDKAEYYSEWIPKNEMVELMKTGGGVEEDKLFEVIVFYEDTKAKANKFGIKSKQFWRKQYKVNAKNEDDAKQETYKQFLSEKANKNKIAKNVTAFELKSKMETGGKLKGWKHRKK